MLSITRAYISRPASWDELASPLCDAIHSAQSGGVIDDDVDDSR